jgi:hypothetical protein
MTLRNIDRIQVLFVLSLLGIGTFLITVGLLGRFLNWASPL